MADIYVKDPYTGRTVRTDEVGARQSLQIGGQLASRSDAEASAEAEANLKKAAELGLPGQAAAGIASGLTLGLGPALAANQGWVDPGMIRALQTTPGYMTGDVAGMLAPAVFSGGESLLLRGGAAAAETAAEQSITRRALSVAARALTPAGIVTEAGSLAEAGMRGLLPEMAGLGSIAKGSLELAARGATEGAMVNMAHTASNSVIKDYPLTWQSIAASGVDGALLGGLVGGGLGALGRVANVTRDGGESVAEVMAARKLKASPGAAEAVGEKDYYSSIAARRVGATPGDLADMVKGEGVPATVEGWKRVLSQEGESFRSSTPAIRDASVRAAQKYESAMDDIVQRFQKEHASSVPDARRIFNEIRKEVDIAYGASVEADFADRMVAETEQSMLRGGEKKWSDWTKSIDQLGKQAKSAGEGGNVTRRIRDVMAREVRASMASADADMAEQFWAAKSGKVLADQMADMSGRKIGEELSKAGMTFGWGDANTMAWSTLGGHPMAGLGVVLGKHALRRLGRTVERYEAEAAYRLAFGAEASGAVATVRKRTSDSVRKFLSGTTSNVAKVAAPGQKKKALTTEEVRKRAEADAELTSNFHEQRVKEFAKDMSQMGHPDLAQQAVLQYLRAKAYYNAVSVPVGAGKVSFTREPVKAMPSMQELKRHRVSSAIRSPLDTVLGGLEDGSLSPETVKAVKYVYPELHQQMVMTTMGEIQAMRAQGKYVDANQEAQLAVLFDAAISPVYEKRFIDSVQATHAAPQGQPPQPPHGGPTLSDSLKTPLQMAT